MENQVTIKCNVQKFDDDVRKSGSYAYTSEKLSAKFANARISKFIEKNYNFSGKRILDIGCGDGTYTLDFLKLGAIEILGIDPALEAIESAKLKAKKAGLETSISFEVGNIYSLQEQLQGRCFDCLVLRGVLHHLPDPQKALKSVSMLANTIIILEPNGFNPILKILERFSRYHREHEERSFFSVTLKYWCRTAGLKIEVVKYLNLVPMFCPNWLAKSCQRIGPVIERIPVLRTIGCGQCLIVASNR